MNHFIDFDPSTTGQHNRLMRKETVSLRLQEQLRKNRKARSSSRLFAVVIRMARSGEPISPGHIPRTKSLDSLVSPSLAVGGKTLWTLR
jgi:hypothetical protein